MKDQLELLGSEVVWQGRIFNITSERLRLPNGREVAREFVFHPGAVVILPVTAEGELIVESQYRQAVRQTILEFPAGTLEREEDPLLCAQRELSEEIGLAAKNWQDLGVVYPAPGVSNETQHLFLASDLEECRREGDEDEIIEAKLYSVRAVEKLIADGVISDGKSIAIFTRARLRGLI